MRREIKSEKLWLLRRLHGHDGFTLVELIVILILFSVLVLIAFSIYNNNINKAKVTVAENVLSQTRENLFLYNIDNGKYPDSIDFNDCLDENGRVVFSPTFCDQLRNDLDSIESYALDAQGYVVIARAKDAKHTLLTVTPTKLTK
jgi:prepilin-type N-terminal cleavage/methylation domain-containing protein